MQINSNEASILSCAEYQLVLRVLLLVNFLILNIVVVLLFASCTFSYLFFCQVNNYFNSFCIRHLGLFTLTANWANVASSSPCRNPSPAWRGGLLGFLFTKLHHLLSPQIGPILWRWCIGPKVFTQPLSKGCHLDILIAPIFGLFSAVKAAILFPNCCDLSPLLHWNVLSDKYFFSRFLHEPCHDRFWFLSPYGTHVEIPCGVNISWALSMVLAQVRLSYMMLKSIWAFLLLPGNILFKPAPWRCVLISWWALASWFWQHPAYTSQLSNQILTRLS